MNFIQGCKLVQTKQVKAEPDSCVSCLHMFVVDVKLHHIFGSSSLYGAAVFVSALNLYFDMVRVCGPLKEVERADLFFSVDNK